MSKNLASVLIVLAVLGFAMFIVGSAAMIVAEIYVKEHAIVLLIVGALDLMSGLGLIILMIYLLLIHEFQ